MGRWLVYHLSSFTCCYRGIQAPLLLNQPMGIWDIYEHVYVWKWAALQRWHFRRENGDDLGLEDSEGDKEREPFFVPERLVNPQNWGYHGWVIFAITVPYVTAMVSWIFLTENPVCIFKEHDETLHTFQKNAQQEIWNYYPPLVFHIANWKDSPFFGKNPKKNNWSSEKYSSTNEPKT